MEIKIIKKQNKSEGLANINFELPHSSQNDSLYFESEFSDELTVLQAELLLLLYLYNKNFLSRDSDTTTEINDYFLSVVFGKNWRENEDLLRLIPYSDLDGFEDLIGSECFVETWPNGNDPATMINSIEVIIDENVVEIDYTKTDVEKTIMTTLQYLLDEWKDDYFEER